MSADPLRDAADCWRWYRTVRELVDDAPDGVRIQLPMVWSTGFPARFVWVDRRLRVWRTDDRGQLFCASSLA